MDEQDPTHDEETGEEQPITRVRRLIKRSHRRIEDTHLISLANATGYEMAEHDDIISIQPPAMLIEGMLPKAAVVGVTSYPGVGKTWFAMEAMRSVSTRTPMFEHFNSVRGPVLFVGSDASIYDYARQWHRLTREQHHALMPDEETFMRIGNPRTPFDNVRFLIQSSFLFDDDDDIRRIIATHEKFQVQTEKGFRLIIFDTLSRLTRANQNDNTEMERVFGNIRLISELTGATCMILHHNSKPTEFNQGADWRGAMSQIGALDTWIHLANSKRDKYKINVAFKKFRGITPEGFNYQMHVSDPDKASLTMHAEVAEEQNVEAAVLAALASGPKTTTDLIDAVYDQFKDLFPENRDQCKQHVRDKLAGKSGKLPSKIIKLKGSPGAPNRWRLRKETDK